MGAALAASFDAEEPVEEQGLTVEEVIAFAKDHVLSYFKDKPYYCGGKIPHHLLVARKRIDLVLDCTFDDAMDIAYEALEKDQSEEDEEVGQDIKSLITTLHNLAYSGVPQELSNGMLVLYLELCLGADVVYA